MQQESLANCKTVGELLSAVGMSEYLDALTKYNVVDVKDMCQLSEEDLKDIGLKFGHRKKLIEIMTQTDPLYAFLRKCNLQKHYKELYELGFDCNWSLMGITEDYRDKMGLSEEEMARVIVCRDALIAEKREEIENLPEFKDLKGSSSSKPVLSLMFSDSRADSLMDVSEKGGNET